MGGSYFYKNVLLNLMQAFENVTISFFSENLRVKYKQAKIFIKFQL